MILVFGGTTEGRRVGEALMRAGLSFIYSTKSEVPAPAYWPAARFRHGPLEQESLAELCAQEHITTIIDAAHPFATGLRATIAQAAVQCGLRVLRLERRFPGIGAQDRDCVVFPEYDRLVQALSERATGTVLFMVGVQPLFRFAFLQMRHRCLFQILPRATSSALAARWGLAERSVFRQAPFTSSEALVSFLRREAITLMVAKESGNSGYEDVKLQAAKLTGVPLWLVARPAIPSAFECHDSVDTLMASVQSQVNRH